MPGRLQELVPHLVAMLGIYMVVVALAGAIAGPLDRWASFAIAATIAVGYPPVTRRLGVAPAAWQR